MLWKVCSWKICCQQKFCWFPPLKSFKYYHFCFLFGFRPLDHKERERKQQLDDFGKPWEHKKNCLSYEHRRKKEKRAKLKNNHHCKKSSDIMSEPRSGLIVGVIFVSWTLDIRPSLHHEEQELLRYVQESSRKNKNISFIEKSSLTFKRLVFHPTPVLV